MVSVGHVVTYEFNSIILDNELINLPILERRYTWFKADGSC